MNMKKILSFAAVLLCLVFCLCSCDEEGYPTATEEFFVNDFADILSENAERDILSRATALFNATTAQVVTVTVESLNGMEPYEYALELGREWGVGSEEENNGVVILLSENDREIYIAVGYGLEGALPDSKTGRIIDLYGLEYLKQDDFSNGINSINKAVINEVYLEYGLEPEEGYTSIDNLYQSQSISGQSNKVIISWIILIILFIIFSGFSGRRRGGFIFFPMSFGSSGSYRGGPGFGGSSGGFRGGGGSFGGGGAGRGF